MLTPDDGPLLAAFAAVARHQSFTAAAKELRLSKSVVSERVRRLEERCDARLLERTTRRLRLTAAGARVLDGATQVGDALRRLSEDLDEERHQPAGLLRVATTNDLGPLLVAPVVARFLGRYPRVRVEVLAEDAPRDLLEARIDVAVRLGAPRQSSFVARKLAILDEPIVAAPALAARLGPITRPRDLAAAPWVRHALLATRTLRFLGPDGARDEIVPSVCAEANSGATLLGLLLHGAGVGVLPEHVLREHLLAGRLVRLCAPWIWKRVALHALTPSRAAERRAPDLFVAMLREQVELDRARWSAVVTAAATAG